MAEYLSPGVYVEEFDSGVKAMEGVGTSTAGFIGMTEKGRTQGIPVLITSMGDFQRNFGGQLSKAEYGDNRFLPYAVEAFFTNGGSSCYVMRVIPKDAKAAEGKITAAVTAATTAAKEAAAKAEKAAEAAAKKAEEAEAAAKKAEEAEEAAKKTETEEAAKKAEEAKAKAEAAKAEAAKAAETAKAEAAKAAETAKAAEAAKDYGKIVFTASSPGKWGNGIKVALSEDFIHKTLILEVANAENGLSKLTVNNASNFCVGDILRLTLGKDEPEYLCIEDINGDALIVSWKLPNSPRKVTVTMDDPLPENFLHLCALRIKISGGSAVEVFENVSLNPASPYFISMVLSKSSLVSASVEGKAVLKNEQLLKQFSPNSDKNEADLSTMCVQLGEGKNGDVKTPITLTMLTGGEDVAGKRIGLNAFKELSDVSIMAVPGCHDAAIQAALIAHCEGLTSRFAILDASIDDVEVSKLTVYKDKFDSNYAAIYHPWLQIYSGVEKGNIFIPPSGAAAGIYARTDNTRGVWKAPANEVVRGVTGLNVNYNDAEQGKLNPNGINLIRAMPGQGIRVWGARTLSSDGNWKYVNVRRLFIFIKESIKKNTNWAVFEPNDENLWSRVKGTITVFLTTQWRNGALAGTSAEQAFYVSVGKGATMTEDDVLNGRLICEIGIAPVRPAEFIIFRITQKMQDAE